MWSVDNEAAAMGQKERERAAKGRRRRGRRVRAVEKRSKGDRVMVSQAMLIEVERVLQTQVRLWFHFIILRVPFFFFFFFFFIRGIMGKCGRTKDIYV